MPKIANCGRWHMSRQTHWLSGQWILAVRWQWLSADIFQFTPNSMNTFNNKGFLVVLFVFSVFLRIDSVWDRLKLIIFALSIRSSWWWQRVWVRVRGNVELNLLFNFCLPLVAVWRYLHKHCQRNFQSSKTISHCSGRESVLVKQHIQESVLGSFSPVSALRESLTSSNLFLSLSPCTFLSHLQNLWFSWHAPTVAVACSALVHHWL